MTSLKPRFIAPLWPLIATLFRSAPKIFRVPKLEKYGTTKKILTQFLEFKYLSMSNLIKIGALYFPHGISDQNPIKNGAGFDFPGITLH